MSAVLAFKLLRFTVCDVLNPDLQPTSGLAGDRGHTIFSPAHGDFRKLANGDMLYPLVVQLWEKLLPKMKELAKGTAGGAAGNRR